MGEEAYRYRADPAVPDFPDDRPVIVFDAVCNLCTALVRWVIARDKTGYFRFVRAQTPLGQALYRHYGLSADCLESILLIDDGRLYQKSDAAFAILRRLGGVWRLIAGFRILPRALRDRLYDAVGRVRYRVFGKRDAPMTPKPEHEPRFIA